MYNDSNSQTRKDNDMRKYCASIVLTFDQFEAKDGDAADVLLEDYTDKLSVLFKGIDSKLVFQSADSYVEHVSF
jgi:hypothetical protein